ncbi:trypsin-like peptidase domain-containing protein [Sorangium cellulosum]|uniref:trypsin-like peptidase domain-containing protein n=1 Tax=Sorangium cellulosum TaxID=56 RepID=UPI0013E9FF48|nr:trypsin-like peptidase domain-containing protein [Sorangium cellulosum]
MGSFVACSAPVEEDEAPDQARSAVIYGDDDREEPFTYSDPAWAARVMEFTVALVPASAVDDSDPNNIQIGDRTWIERDDVCPDVRFATQPALADCSGTLIGEDLVLTAGHCINNCGASRFVFDYAMTPAGQLGQITSDDLYRCVDIITWYRDTNGADYTVVRLDRPVVGRTPAAVRTSTEPLDPDDDTPLVVHGFPRGLPLKLADGATIRSNDPDNDFFVANLDTFVGNSGSGVFDLDTKELVGVLVRGERDFERDEVNDCNRPFECDDNACRGEDVTYAFRAIQGLCERAETDLCSCGDGACGPLEDPASCPGDCSCGDGICSSGEDTASCPADCQLEVLYDVHTPQSNWVTPGIQVRNTSAQSASLWGSTVRYYFTQEPPGSLEAECWGCSADLEMSFHEVPGGGCADATHYLDVTFPFLFEVEPMATTDPFRIAFHASSWQAFNESNDYSYAGTSSDWAPNRKITLYRNGFRVFGDEPCPGLFIPPPN